MRSESNLFTKCPKCENKIVINQVYEAGGVNDHGGFILECNKCHHIFAEHIGRDIQMSSVISGATKLDVYDNEIEGDKEAALKKYQK